jgi:hypothetical protein
VWENLWRIDADALFPAPDDASGGLLENNAEIAKIGR